MPQAVYDYHYGMEAEQYAFFRIPKLLMTEPHFKVVSTDAKLLYGLLLDRMNLSVKNGWLDEEGRVYIYFTLAEAGAQLGCKSDKAVKLFAELDSVKGVGLIQRIKQGQGRPARIYVMRFCGFAAEHNQDFDTGEVKTSENQKSRLRENRTKDFGKSEANNTEDNNTEDNNTDMNKTNLSIVLIEGYRERIRENIAYDILIRQFPRADLDELVELVVEVLCAPVDLVKIGGRQVYAELARERLLRLNAEHICYVMECLENHTGEIRNIKAYLLETLFNASVTLGSFYRAKVNYDFFNTG